MNFKKIFKKILKYKKISKYSLFLIIFALIILIYGCSSIQSLTGNIVVEVPEDSGPPIEIIFCQTDNCLKRFVDLFEESKSIDCAFFDVDNPIIKEILEEKYFEDKKNINIVIDGENSDYVEGAVIEETSSYMHNKFCIFDMKTVWTGSMNPTSRGIENNDNNVIIINSRSIVKNYKDEFDELFNGIYGKGNSVKFPIVRYNNVILENYFCPEDSCQEKIIKRLNESKESIYFMTFSFTDDDISYTLQKKIREGIDVRGVIEARMTGGDYSEYNSLLEVGIDVRKDNNPATMHHKVFIIDNRTVITGSMNPTKNGNEKNDENLLIIHDEYIASAFLKEFVRVYEK